MRAACFNFSLLSSARAVRAATDSIIEETRSGLAKAQSLQELDGTLTRFYNEAMPIQFLRLVSTDAEVTFFLFFHFFFHVLFF